MTQKRISEFENRLTEIMQWRTNRKKKKNDQILRDWSYQCTHNGRLRLGGEKERKGQKRQKRILEEMVAKNFLNLLETMNLNIQETQWIPSKINSETSIYTHRNKMVEGWRQSLKSRNGKAII